MPLPDSVAALVARFEANRKEYHQAHYNETQTRIDFVNPLFLALGWDMDNRKALSEVQREVIHEDALKIGGTTKAPDYGFRAGGQRRFFLETKKPSVNLKLLAAPAYQLRRYAWTAKLPVSILTNFEEFAVYDGRVIPDHKDGPTVARLDYFKYTEMAERWDEIAARFSHDAVLSGAFDRYAAEAPGRKSFIPVDAAFLARISDWRETLARNIVANNPGVTPRELNYAVQMIIDRIIFLRISEDRGVETQYRLEPLQNGARVYPRLLELFRHADARYNSGLFHFGRETGRGEPDDITPRLTLDDRLLRDILGGLYGDKNPYVFSIFPADILGQVYEQFLGQVIRVSGKTAEVEDKPEVKKAGGVYYTPTYIVRYIVENTVGKLVDGKTPAQVAKLTVLDPACGSGSFLIGAYQFLLDWHLRYYTDHDPAKLAKGKKAVLYLAAKDAAGNNVWRLTTAEKKRILLANIYGVDIDTQAVEVTKLSLLLKVLENESAELIDNTLKLLQERALPDLENNIKCGNSLIGPDFYADKGPALFDLDARLKINAFDWKTAFAKVMADGGFDAVIGNPPYIRIQTMKEWAPLDVEFYKTAYASAGKGNYDIYVVFVEKGLRLLNKAGRLGFILPHKFFNSQYGQPLRKLISDGKHLDSVVHFGDQQIFADATTYTCLLMLRKAQCEQFQFSKVAHLEAWRQSHSASECVIPEANVTDKDWNFSADGGAALFERLDRMPSKLRDVAARIGQGVRTSANEVYVLDLLSTNADVVEVRSKQLMAVIEIEKKAATPFLQGREIKRYAITSPQKVAVVPYRVTKSRTRLITEKAIRRKFPLTYSYLAENKEYLEKREKGRFAGANWYVFGRQQNIDLMLMPKILVPDIADKAAFALDEEGRYAFTIGYGITLKKDVAEAQKYVLGLLNSRLLNFYLKKVTTPMRGGFFRYFTQFIEQLPIRRLDFSKPAEKAEHDRMVTLVEQMLKLHKDKAGARLGQEKAVLQQQIEATDAQIDRLVYDLYGLTEGEIKIVEGETIKG